MSDVLLAQKWSDEDPAGYWVSEKLDGVRAVWKNGKFVSRGDNNFVCPDWFRRKMPANCTLDGELWGGRRQFQKTVGIVKSSTRGAEWEYLTYMVFDVMEEGGASLDHWPFEDRLEVLKRICHDGDGIKAVPMQRCRGRDHLQELLAEVETRGGEGLMLRQPKSLYEHRRSKCLLKVKTFHDEEAVVVSHELGKGRNSDVCGALICKTPDGRQFKVGSGLSDAQRSDPPKVGDVITYRYQELTAANIPRFPTLAGLRIDLNWSQICATYVAPGPRAALALKKKHSVLFGDQGGAVVATGSGASSSSSGAPAAPATTVAPAVAELLRSHRGPATAPAATAPAESLAGLSSEVRRQIKRSLSHLDVMQRGVAEEDMVDLLDDGDEVGGTVAAAAGVTAESPLKKPKLDERPVCVYGAKCYRKNPMHFEEFKHPWMDHENLDVADLVTEPEAVTGGAAASASSSAPAPSRVSAADAIAGIACSTADLGSGVSVADVPSAVAGAAAADGTAGPRKDVMSMLMASSTSLFVDGRAQPVPAGSPARAVAPGPVPAQATPEVDALQRSFADDAERKDAAIVIVAETDAYATQAGNPELSNLPGACRDRITAVASVAPSASPDQRIFALRSLLSGLSQDAPSNAERAHFTYILGLLEAGPNGHRGPAASASSEAASSSSKPRISVSPVPPSLHEIGEASVFALGPADMAVFGLPPPLPPATISSTKSTAADVNPLPPTTTVPTAAPAVAPAAAAAESPVRDPAPRPEEVVGDTPAKREAALTLSSMGFGGDDVVAALQHADALEPALEWLLARSAL